MRGCKGVGGWRGALDFQFEVSCRSDDLSSKCFEDCAKLSSKSSEECVKLCSRNCEILGTWVEANTLEKTLEKTREIDNAARI